LSQKQLKGKIAYLRLRRLPARPPGARELILTTTVAYARLRPPAAIHYFMTMATMND